MSEHPFIDPIHPHDFNEVSSSVRAFFSKKGLKEVHVQHRLSILAACEDPSTIATYEYAGSVYPLPQTGQMWLEHELLKNPIPTGYFCVSTSYRQELNPKPGRHNLIFPMIEFEIPGNMDTLQAFESDLLQHLQYPMQQQNNINDDTVEFYYPKGEYRDVASKYGVTDLGHEHEARLYDDYGSVFFLRHFPFETSPFWNMKANMDTKTANKIDVILSGFETISSAERSSDPHEMRTMFYTISDGMYAKTLFSRFGKDRVESELNAFLTHKFTPRSGGGIGVTRLIKSLKMEGLMRLPQ
jgi:aspartyl/asparaginyl-tRNA synthetase